MQVQAQRQRKNEGVRHLLIEAAETGWAATVCERVRCGELEGVLNMERRVFCILPPEEGMELFQQVETNPPDSRSTANHYSDVYLKEGEHPPVEFLGNRKDLEKLNLVAILATGTGFATLAREESWGYLERYNTSQDPGGKPHY